MKKIILAVIFLICLLPIVLLSEVPHLMNYQGLLTDDSGQPVEDDLYAITFKIYDKDSGGNPVWSETQNVSTTNGVFNVTLGSVNPITEFPSENAWLAIKVGDNNEMVPRKRISSVGYSFKSEESVKSQESVNAMNAENAQYWDGHEYQYPPISWYEWREGAQNLNIGEYDKLSQVNIELPVQMNVVAEAWGPLYGEHALDDRVRMVVVFYDQQGSFIFQGAEGINYCGPYTKSVLSLPAGEYIVALWAYRTSSTFDVYNLTFSVTAYESDNSACKKLNKSMYLQPPEKK